MSFPMEGNGVFVGLGVGDGSAVAVHDDNSSDKDIAINMGIKLNLVNMILQGSVSRSVY